MSEPLILFVEDEPALAEIVKETLESRGFRISHAASVSQGLAAYMRQKPDIMVLDVMLPDGDGFSMLKKIRSTDRQTPALFLSSKSLPTDVVNGFESGASDYVKKPFSMEELIVRIRALLGMVQLKAEAESRQNRTISVGEYTFHYPGGLLVYKGTKRQLTFREAEILNMLCNQRNEMIYRRDLLIKHWGNDDYFSGRSLDVFITKLRKYLKEDPSIAILNFRGLGYKLIS